MRHFIPEQTFPIANRDPNLARSSLSLALCDFILCLFIIFILARRRVDLCCFGTDIAFEATSRLFRPAYFLHTRYNSRRILTRG